MGFIKTTEGDSYYDNLEEMTIQELLVNINNEDKKVALAVEKSLPQIEQLVEAAVEKLKSGGRLFYIGAGTSGRLGILDASECPPTFGVSHDKVIGLIAGGEEAIRKAVENAEDSTNQGWLDLQEYDISEDDYVVGIAASGTTPYVVSTLEKCNSKNINTGCITCNAGSPLSTIAKNPVEVIVGSEFVTGSSRMKAGTAQKMVLNMISTACMIQLGRVQGNKMVDMQLSNYKLEERALKMIIDKTECSYKCAKHYLELTGNVRGAIAQINSDAGEK